MATASVTNPTRSTTMRRRLLVVVVALAAASAIVSPARAAIDQPVASWQMNEPAGATTMLDSSGNAINGAIGAHVQEGTALSGGGTGYRFPYLQPNTPPADPEHVVRVAHDARLNPGSGGLRGRVPDAYHPFVRQHHP